MLYANDFTKPNRSSFKIDDILKPNCDNVIKSTKYTINEIIKPINSAVKSIQNQQNNSFLNNFNDFLTRQQHEVEDILTNKTTNTSGNNKKDRIQNKKNADSHSKNHKAHKCGGSFDCFKHHDAIPMCLRGVSNEQMNLANLFNTLIHHKKCRRTRTVFTDSQLVGLEKRFDSQKYLSTSDRIELASTLGLSQLQVKTWYQNRRMKWKKQVLKDGCSDAPTKPKGRPKKNSIPSLSEILQAKALGIHEAEDDDDDDEDDDDNYSDTDISVLDCSDCDSQDVSDNNNEMDYQS